MQGTIYLPYLHEWNPHNPIASNLVGLAEICSSVFSIEPPLFSKPTVAAPVSSTTSSSSSAYAVNAYGFGGASATGATPAMASSYSTPIAAATAAPVTLNSYGTSAAINSNRNAISAAGYPASSSGMGSSMGSGMGSSMGSGMGGGPVAAVARPNMTFSAVATTANAAMAFGSVSATGAAQAQAKRKELLDKVNMKLQERVYSLHSQYNKELAAEFQNEKYLEASKQEAEEHIEIMKKMIEEMNQSLQQIEDQKVALQKWTEEQEQKAQPAPEDHLQAYDDLSNQIVRLNGEINAIDDALYFLERALVSSQNKSIDLNGFLREVRNLARQQFMCRAHLAKIQNHCINSNMQQQQTQQQMAPPQPQPTSVASPPVMAPSMSTAPAPMSAAVPAPIPSNMMSYQQSPIPVMSAMGGMAPVAAVMAPSYGAYPAVPANTMPNAPTHLPPVGLTGYSAVPASTHYQPNAYPAL
jgi:ESCRT-I complex subunit TSG101